MKVKRENCGFSIICSVLDERKGSREDAMEWYAPWNIRAMPLWMRRTLLALVILFIPFCAGDVRRDGFSWGGWHFVVMERAPGRADLRLAGAAQSTEGLIVSLPGTFARGGVEYRVREVGPLAFAQTAIREVRLPETVEVVDYLAFALCQSLEHVQAPRALRRIETGAFFICPSLEKVEFLDGSSLEWIGDKAFEDCGSLESLKLPASLAHIGDEAFFQTALRQVRIHEGIDELGIDAFWGCKRLENAVFDADSPLLRVPDGCFAGCESLKEVSLPRNLLSIGYGAFSGSGIESITLSRNLCEIQGGAFHDCHLLDSVTFHEGLTDIEDDAFGGTGLRYVTIPRTVTYIGARAFEECGYLRQAQIKCHPSAIDPEAFDGPVTAKPDGSLSWDAEHAPDWLIMGRDMTWEKGGLQVRLPDSMGTLLAVRRSYGAMDRSEYELAGHTLLLLDNVYSDGSTSRNFPYPESLEFTFINGILKGIVIPDVSAPPQ